MSQENNNTNISSSGNKIPQEDMISCIIEAIQDTKGHNISVIDMAEIESSPAPAFVICDGKSTTQVSAIADRVMENMRTGLDISPSHIDGYRNSQWIVMDFGAIIVHVFLPDTRSLYNLEDLWSDAEITQIPDLD